MPCSIFTSFNSSKLKSRHADLPKPILKVPQAHTNRNLNLQWLYAATGVPRLFDLVSVADLKIKLAFYYALRNTLVAKDLEQASRIAYGRDRRFGRVVTMAGQLIAGELGDHYHCLICARSSEVP